MKNKYIFFITIIHLLFLLPHLSYASDVYVEWGTLKIPADPNTFEEINYSSKYFKDKDNVFYFNKILEDANPDSFEVFKNSDYAKDNKNAYCDGKLISNDAENFTIINLDYAKDSNYVYYFCNILEDTDPDTIELLGVGYSKDTNHAFFNNKIIQNADAKSFQMIGSTKQGVFALDNSHVFLNDKIKNELFYIYDKDLYKKLKGKIILRADLNGEAYFVNNELQLLHFLGRPEDAFAIMGDLGVGISEVNINKIPLSLENLSGNDNDKDGLPDLFEDSIGTDKNNLDTDNDTYNDKEELLNNFNPLNKDVLSWDEVYTRKQAGKILLQVEKNGEAWYVNPNNNKRYFLGRPNDSFNIMKTLGLGINEDNFNKLTKTLKTNNHLEVFDNNTYNYKISLPNIWKCYSEYDGSTLANSPATFPNNPSILTGTPPSIDFQINLIENMEANSYKINFLEDAQIDGSKFLLDDRIIYLVQNKNNLLTINSTKFENFNEIIDSIEIY